jgi:23S rRNA (cytidine1920-2'-O)/16S rRNA (cytidine1409-2'-O)-methyltransferase
MSPRVPAGAGCDRRPGRQITAGPQRQHPAIVVVSASLARWWQVSENRRSARARDHWRPLDLLVAGAAETAHAAPTGPRPEIMSAPAKRLRLDELLVARGLAETRAQAKALVMAGRVRHGTERLDKPGKEFPADWDIAVDQPPRFVSRGGEKLAAALAHFALDLRGAHVLDVGASTGGFTDCALQAGAADVVCVDVGRAQLHARLRADPRVTNREKLNARHLRASDLPRAEFDAIVMDLSFISLTAVLPAVWPLLRAGGTLIALVKPQFEAGKAEVDKGRGVIRDAAVQEKTLATVREFALAQLRGATLVGSIDSPITGADGNREFLLALRKT